jgi:hypothetical protein
MATGCGLPTIMIDYYYYYYYLLAGNFVMHCSRATCAWEGPTCRREDNIWCLEMEEGWCKNSGSLWLAGM